MPPIRKISKQDIIDTAYEIVKNEGFSHVNSRRIAKELNCSIQPIFHNFQNMDELNKIVYQKIYEKYQEYMMRGKTLDKSYKQMGLGYIKFAKDYPIFFKILFMQKTNLDAENFVMHDTLGDDIIKAGQKLTGFSYQEQKKFHIKVWIFTHGIACLIATNTIEISDSELDELLETTVREMAKGYQLNKEENK